MKSYIPRLVDAELERGLRTSGAVEVCGPRACGKTETARQAVNAAGGSQIRLDVAGVTMDLLRSAPEQILVGDVPRLIDEWQSIPEVWNLVRHEIDDRGEKGQFILTGSSTPEEESQRHSGAGRIRRLTMRTMSLLERGLVQANVSLEALFDGTAVAEGGGEASVSDYIEWMASGGWPGFVGLDAADAADEVSAYLEQIEEHDFPIVGGMRAIPEDSGPSSRHTRVWSPNPHLSPRSAGGSVRSRLQSPLSNSFRFSMTSPAVCSSLKISPHGPLDCVRRRASFKRRSVTSPMSRWR